MSEHPNHTDQARAPEPALDLGKPLPGHNYSSSITPQESVGDRRVRLFKDVALFVAALVFVGIIAWLCIRTLLNQQAAADEQKWAMSILSAAAGALIGYLVRK